MISLILYPNMQEVLGRVFEIMNPEFQPDGEDRAAKKTDIIQALSGLSAESATFLENLRSLLAPGGDADLKALQVSAPDVAALSRLLREFDQYLGEDQKAIAGNFLSKLSAVSSVATLTPSLLGSLDDSLSRWGRQRPTGIKLVIASPGAPSDTTAEDFAPPHPFWDRKLSNVIPRPFLDGLTFESTTLLLAVWESGQAAHHETEALSKGRLINSALKKLVELAVDSSRHQTFGSIFDFGARVGGFEPIFLQLARDYFDFCLQPENLWLATGQSPTEKLQLVFLPRLNPKLADYEQGLYLDKTHPVESLRNLFVTLVNAYIGQGEKLTDSLQWMKLVTEREKHKRMKLVSEREMYVPGADENALQGLQDEITCVVDLYQQYIQSAHTTLHKNGTAPATIVAFINSTLQPLLTRLQTEFRGDYVVMEMILQDELISLLYTLRNHCLAIGAIAQASVQQGKLSQLIEAYMSRLQKEFLQRDPAPYPAAAHLSYLTYGFLADGNSFLAQLGQHPDEGIRALAEEIILDQRAALTDYVQGSVHTAVESLVEAIDNSGRLAERMARLSSRLDHDLLTLINHGHFLKLIQTAIEWSFHPLSLFLAQVSSQEDLVLELAGIQNRELETATSVLISGLASLGDESTVNQFVGSQQLLAARLRRVEVFLERGAWREARRALKAVEEAPCSSASVETLCNQLEEISDYHVTNGVPPPLSAQEILEFRVWLSSFRALCHELSTLLDDIELWCMALDGIELRGESNAPSKESCELILEGLLAKGLPVAGLHFIRNIVIPCLVRISPTSLQILLEKFMPTLHLEATLKLLEGENPAKPLSKEFPFLATRWQGVQALGTLFPQAQAIEALDPRAPLYGLELAGDIWLVNLSDPEQWSFTILARDNDGWQTRRFASKDEFKALALALFQSLSHETRFLSGHRPKVLIEALGPSVKPERENYFRFVAKNKGETYELSDDSTSPQDDSNRADGESKKSRVPADSARATTSGAQHVFATGRSINQATAQRTHPLPGKNLMSVSSRVTAALPGAGVKFSSAQLSSAKLPMPRHPLGQGSTSHGRPILPTGLRSLHRGSPVGRII